MGIFNNWFGKQGFEVYEESSYNIQNIGNIIIPEKLTNENAYMLANSVAEIFFPIDFYADRISKLTPFIATKNGTARPNTELNRFISDGINPLFSFSDLVYNYVFSYFADGNAISYLGVPSIYKDVTPSSIERWDVLQPDMVTLYEFNNVSLLKLSKNTDAIKVAYYNDGMVTRNPLNINQLRVDNFGLRRQSNSIVKAEGVLWKSNKSIDTLLSVYSARYNVYANNGMAGILAKKQSATGGMETALMNGNKRDEIIADIKERHGLTGKKNIFGVSGVPIEFVKTIAAISELMPLEETLESAIKIASTMQIPPVLVPRKDQSTYDNQENAERNVWENGLLSAAKTVASNLTRLFGLDKIGYQILFDTSNVSSLTENASKKEELNTKKLANIEKMKQLNPDLDVNSLILDIYNDYGHEE